MYVQAAHLMDVLSGTEEDLDLATVSNYANISFSLSLSLSLTPSLSLTLSLSLSLSLSLTLFLSFTLSLFLYLFISPYVCVHFHTTLFIVFYSLVVFIQSSTQLFITPLYSALTHVTPLCKSAK